jgi:hypothetical protein
VLLQAMCRIYRFGQEQNVEVVKIIVTGTIDRYLLDIQQRKSDEIKDTIGDEALQQRDTVDNLLKMFCVVPDSQGGFVLLPDGEKERRHKMEEDEEDEDEVEELD